MADISALRLLQVESLLSKHLGEDYAAVAAAGSDQSSATQLLATINIINDGTDNQGVRLPDLVSWARGECGVSNTTTSVIKVYAFGSQKIDYNYVFVYIFPGQFLRFSRLKSDHATWTREPYGHLYGGSWNPTYIGWFTSVTTNLARWFQIGRMVYINLSAVGVISGTPGTDLTVSLPVNASGNAVFPTGGAFVRDAAVGIPLPSACFVDEANHVLVFRKQDGSAFTLGDNRIIHGSCWYLTI